MSYAGNESTRLATGWQRFKAKCVRIIKVTAACAALVAVTAGIYMAGQWTAPVQAVEVEKAVYIEKLPEQIEKLKDNVVAELEKCESSGYASDKGIIIFDSNNKASVGPLQMQKDHVIHFSMKLYNKSITGMEAVKIAIDPVTARPFAKDVLFKVEDGWKEWYNCGRKLGLETKIDYIKEMEAIK